MIPSEEKLRAMNLRIAKALSAEPGIALTDAEQARRVIREGLAAGLRHLQEIHEKARAKVESLSRRVAPGSREWDDLFAQYLSEELRRRGL